MNNYQVAFTSDEIESEASNALTRNPFMHLLLQDRFLIKQRDLKNCSERQYLAEDLNDDAKIVTVKINKDREENM